MGDKSLFDTPPENNYSNPTKKTTEQRIESKNSTVQPTHPPVNPNLEETTLM